MWADNLFNELAKSSANFIPDARKQAGKLVGTPVDFSVHPKDPVDKDEVVRLLKLNGADAKIADTERVRVSGDLGSLPSPRRQTPIRRSGTTIAPSKRDTP